MSADNEVDGAAEQVAGLTLQDTDNYNPDTVSYEVATFALSWFWFPEAQFGSAPGVLRTKVGFAGGKKKGPTYYSL